MPGLCVTHRTGPPEHWCSVWRSSSTPSIPDDGSPGYIWPVVTNAELYSRVATGVSFPPGPHCSGKGAAPQAVAAWPALSMCSLVTLLWSRSPVRVSSPAVCTSLRAGPVSVFCPSLPVCRVLFLFSFFEAGFQAGPNPQRVALTLWSSCLYLLKC